MKAGDLVTLRRGPDGRYLDNFLYVYKSGFPNWEAIEKWFPGDVGLIVNPESDIEGMIFVLIKEKLGWVDVGYLQKFDGEYLVD